MRRGKAMASEAGSVCKSNCSAPSKPQAAPAQQRRTPCLLVVALLLSACGAPPPTGGGGVGYTAIAGSACSTPGLAVCGAAGPYMAALVCANALWTVTSLCAANQWCGLANNTPVCQGAPTDAATTADAPGGDATSDVPQVSPDATSDGPPVLTDAVAPVDGNAAADSLDLKETWAPVDTSGDSVQSTQDTAFPDDGWPSPDVVSPVQCCINKGAQCGFVAGCPQTCGSCSVDKVCDTKTGPTKNKCISKFVTPVEKCAPGDSACLQSCVEVACTAPSGDCAQDSKCSALGGCLQGCENVALPKDPNEINCYQKCITTAGSTAVAKFYKAQACTGEKCFTCKAGDQNCQASCASQACLEPMFTCQSDNACAGLLDCITVNKCADQTCLQACITKFADGQSAFMGFLQCYQANASNCDQ